MALFGNDIVSGFVSNPHVRNKLGTYELLNNDGLMSYFMSGLFENLHQMYSEQRDIDEKSSAILGRLINQFVAKNEAMCDGVNAGYVNACILNSMNRAVLTFDIIIIVDASAPPASAAASVAKPRSRRQSAKAPTFTASAAVAAEFADRFCKEKLDKICGFLISEQGECPKYPDACSVKLICANVRGISSLLLGCYMYAIKLHPEFMQIGLLELANGLDNLNGFCAYRKMGFVIDPDIFTGNCLTYNVDMLPMSVQLDPMSLDDIIRHSTTSITIDEPICNRNYGVSPPLDKDPEVIAFRGLIKNFYKLYYAATMFFNKKHVITYPILFSLSNNRNLIRSLLNKYDVAPIGNIAQYNIAKELLMRILDYIQGHSYGASITAIKGRALKDAYNSLYTEFPSDSLSTNPFLQLIVHEIHEIFDAYVAYKQGIRDDGGVPVAKASAAAASVSSSLATKLEPPSKLKVKAVASASTRSRRSTVKAAPTKEKAAPTKEKAAPTKAATRSRRSAVSSSTATKKAKPTRLSASATAAKAAIKRSQSSIKPLPQQVSSTTAKRTGPFTVSNTTAKRTGPFTTTAQSLATIGR